jgi:hypothetical protein
LGSGKRDLTTHEEVPCPDYHLIYTANFAPSCSAAAPSTATPIFVDGRLSPWRNRVPEASSRQARVQALIALLADAANAAGENALVLFLQVLRDWTDPGTACYRDLETLTLTLSGVAEGTSPGAPARSPAGADAGSATQATLNGDGAIAQGEGATAVGAGGVLIEGDVEGDVVTGSKHTTFDQRGQHAGRIINVAGDYYDNRGSSAPRDPASEPGRASDRAEDVEGLPAPALPVLRRGLKRLDDVALDALCMDHFPVVYDRFSRGMRRDEKMNLLLDHCRRNPAEGARLAALL